MHKYGCLTLGGYVVWAYTVARDWIKLDMCLWVGVLYLLLPSENLSNTHKKISVKKVP